MILSPDPKLESHPDVTIHGVVCRGEFYSEVTGQEGTLGPLLRKWRSPLGTRSGSRPSGFDSMTPVSVSEIGGASGPSLSLR